VKKNPKGRKLRPKKAESLRDRAEGLLREDPPLIPQEDLSALVHELQVHQIELEMQNTKLRKAQEKLEESRNRYYDLYAFAPVGYITLSTSGVILECNLAGAGTLGVVRSRLLGKFFQGLIFSEDLHLFLGHRERLLGKKEKDVCELRLRRKDQVFFCRMESLCQWDHHGNPAAIRSALVDITRLKETEERLRKANERFSAMAENARDIISRRDRDLRCTYINPAIGVYAKMGRNAFLGKTPEETKALGEFPRQVQEALAEVIRSGSEKTVEFEYDTPSGPKSFHAILIPEKDREGAVESVLTISRDLTELKQLQRDLENRVRERTADLERANLKLIQEIRKREKFERALRDSTEKIIQEARKRRFLSARLVQLLEKDRRTTAMTLHDHLGQLLTTIKMDLEMTESAEAEEARALIGRAKEKMMEALRFSRDAINQLRPVSLDTLGLVSSMESLIGEIGKSYEGVSFSFFSRPLPSTLGKEKELVLYRIAQEAIMNALKHASPKNIFVNLIAKDKTALLTIEDDGTGFDFEKKAVSPDGALGIGIMEERLSLVGGQLKIDSQPGKGTQVIAEVPIFEDN